MSADALQSTDDGTDGEPFLLEDVDDVAGDLEEGRTVEVLLNDGRVVVARVRQIQTGDIACRVPGCFRRFDSQRAMESHVGKQHPEARKKECPVCGDTFDPNEASQRYCSNACYHEDGRSTLSCENCGDEFQVKASHADNRRHCSHKCRTENDDYDYIAEKERKNSRVEAECEHCGETFEHYPSRSRRYCSRDCQSADTWETRECPMCAAEFEVRAAEDKEFCGRQCFYESRHDRPWDEHDLLVELFEEGHDPDVVRQRAKANLGAEWDNHAALEVAAAAIATKERRSTDEKARRFEDLVGERLPRQQIQRQLVKGAIAAIDDVPSHVSADAVLETHSDVETLYEFTQELRMSRSPARQLLSRSGLGDIDSADVEARAKERLDELVETPDTHQKFSRRGSR